MQLVIRISLLLILFVCNVTSVASDQNRQPNIIVVMADDHALWATGEFSESNVAATPNLDWLAENGVNFSNAMTPAPVCSPARASFFTGLLPSQHGVHDFLDENLEFDADWLNGQTLLSQRLKDEGYRTGLFGKWHATSDSKPPQRGFDRWLSYDVRKAGWRNQYVHSGDVLFSDDGRSYEFSGVQSHFLTEEAIRFIDEDSDEPFYISLNYVEPHAPYENLPPRLVEKHRDIARKFVKKGDFSDMQLRLPRAAVPPDHVEQLTQYLAAVSLVDHQIGRLLDALHGRKLFDNTILIFTSDHGLLVGQYGLYGKTNATNPVNFYEETIRIPLIVYGPENLILSHQIRREFVDLIDLHATILDFSSNGGITVTPNGPGKSFRPLLLGNRVENWRSVQFAERGNARMITNGKWKLVRYYHLDGIQSPTDVWYDLSHPQGERHSVSPPRSEFELAFVSELENYFGKYETAAHTGRNIWRQPPPNPRMRDEVLNDLKNR